MTPTKGVHPPERKGAPETDPAVVAAKEAQEAAAAFSAIAKTCRTSDDETTPEFVAADKRTTEADAAFADAPVTSVAGALAKMREIAALNADDNGTSLDSRHIKTVAAFLEGFSGAPSVVVVDPAVAALAEYRDANAALEAFPNDEAEADTPEYEAAGTRRFAARSAVYDAVPTSLAGVAAKVRFILDHEERGNELWVPFDYMAKSMLPFLEGGAAAAPDPVVTLFAKWGAINEEVMVLSAAIPEGAGTNMGEAAAVPGKPWVAEEEKEWDAALDRRDAMERQILETPATSIKGVAVKVRLASHYAFEVASLAPLYDTPSRDIDYVELEGGAGGALNDHLVSALRDAERLAGVS